MEYNTTLKFINGSSVVGLHIPQNIQQDKHFTYPNVQALSGWTLQELLAPQELCFCDAN